MPTLPCGAAKAAPHQFWAEGAERPPLILLDEGSPGGAYVLRIRVAVALAVRFGRFQGGAALWLPQGDYAYVGSAIAARGPAGLGRRLLRHATRSGAKLPHALRPALAAALAAAGVEGGLPAGKRCRWHVDWLLDEGAAELMQVLAVRGTAGSEKRLAACLLADGRAQPLAPGLGASDHPGATHLLAAPDADIWWRALADRLATQTDS